jgi:hypothetical protein
VVVAVGLTLVEPLTDVEVNVPGVIAMLAAPVVTQLNVAFVPGLMPVGFATKEVIAGIVSLPAEELDDPPQPASPTQATRTETNRTPASRTRNNGTRGNRTKTNVVLFVW